MNTSPPAQRPPADAGVSLVEVMVAMLIFAIISSGLMAGSVTIARVTADARARVVAANLAAEQIDDARSKGDPFAVSAVPRTEKTVGGRTYYVQRSVKWVSTGGADLECNSSTTLFYLRVNARVGWSGQLSSTPDVQDDTLMAPDAKVNDASTGAISISVIGADGTPQKGIPVTVKAKVGGTGRDPAAVKPTTAAGCTYATQVVPGAYTVSVAKAGWLDTAQAPTSTTELSVVAGGTASYQFQYDQAATFNVSFVGAGAVYAGRPSIPSLMTTSLINSKMSAGLVSRATTTDPTALKLHPFTDGYLAVAGVYTSGSSTCQAVDPTAWTNGPASDGTPLKAGVRPQAAASAGGSTTLQVPIGVVMVKANAGTAITATRSRTTAVPGNPGCAIAGSYSVKASGAETAIALPFGSWTIKAGTATVQPTDLRVPTNAAGERLNVFSGGLVVLDPREAE